MNTVNQCAAVFHQHRSQQDLTLNSTTAQTTVKAFKYLDKDAHALGHPRYSWMMDGTQYLQGNCTILDQLLKKTELSSSCQREGESHVTVVSGC